MNEAVSTSEQPPPAGVRRYSYLRHAWPLRLTHWINLIALVILLMSGLQIFNAHPSLNWGKSSYNGRPPVLQMWAFKGPDGKLTGITDVLGKRFHTTGWLGASVEGSGPLVPRGFPSWLTVPAPRYLAAGRHWHFLFAWIFVINGVAYLAYTLVSRHLVRELTPTRLDWRSIGRSILDHVRLRHPQGEDARRYNVLQKLAYLSVIFILLPFVVLMGLAMSPRFDAIAPGWVDLVGGRQSARTLHFIGANLIVLFALVHVFEVIITGLWNNLRSMITGRYEIRLTHQTPNYETSERNTI